MRKKFHKRVMMLAASAFVLTISLAVGNAMAYFTTFTAAGGSVRMNMGFTETEVVDEVDSAGKHIAISNTGDYDCFVRVKVFSTIEIEYLPESGWEQEDGYWYYRDVLPPGGSTSELLVTFDYPKNAGEDRTEEFDIIVVHECTPVMYDDAGNPSPDWNNIMITGSTEQ